MLTIDCKMLLFVVHFLKLDVLDRIWNSENPRGAKI